jgi:hypothetical protein
LLELQNSDNPSEFADRRNLDVNNGRVQVIAELPLNSETELSQFSWISVQEQVTTDDTILVQAMVEIDQLETLANKESVGNVRPPDSPKPGTVSSGEQPPSSDDSNDLIQILIGGGVLGGVLAIGVIAKYRRGEEQ